MAKLTKRANTRPNTDTDSPEDTLESFETADVSHAATTESEGAAAGGVTPTPAQAPQMPTARVYKGTQELDHDLFKLEVAHMRKNVSYTEIPDYEKFEHCHIFHTIDSSGKRQAECTPVGGHHHAVKVNRNGAGVPTLEVGPPVRWVKRKIRGRYERVQEPIEGDEHTHTVTYLGSEKIKVREPNMEFAKLDAATRAKQEPVIEGVVG